MKRIDKAIDKLEQVKSDLFHEISEEDYAGYDPFDGLNSKLFDLSPLSKSRFMRLAWLQFHKRSPINFRRVVGVPKKRNPKGIALMILGLLEEHERTPKKCILDEARYLAEWLVDHHCDIKEWGHICWGYHFDWQARAYYVPVGKPNMITTCYVIRALRKLGKVSGDQFYIKTALEATKFISKKLYLGDQSDGYFAYIPGEETFVHNASLWGAAMVAWGGVRLNDKTMLMQSHNAVKKTLNAQKKDGSWAYGTRSHHQFVDGFHTGYNIEALYLYQKILNTQVCQGAIQHGLDYYKKHFFAEDGMPKYYNNKTYPIDPHLSAQAAITLLKVGGEAEDQKLAEKVLNWTVDNMYLPDKHLFLYQRTKWFDNKIPYMRWTQAWMYYALALYQNRGNKPMA